MKKYIIFTLILNYILTQSIEISGIIKDSKGNIIPDVNVYSNSKGTTSNKEGKFNIIIKKNDIIVISHIGFEQKIYTPNNIPKIIILNKATILGKNIYVNSTLDNRDLYNTPASITLFNSKELSIISDNHFEGLLGQIANLNYSGGTSRPRYFQIRGIGERSHYAGEGPPNYSVGFFVDGIDYSGIGMIGHLFDTKQVEIFKGPQSTVFGPNSMAGSINITTNDPTPFYTSKIETFFSSDNGKNYSLAIGGPIVKNLNFRIAGLHHTQNGFRKNLFFNQNDTNGKNETLYRIKLFWSLRNDFHIHYTNTEHSLNNKYDAWAPDNNFSLNTYSNRPGQDSQDSQAQALKIEFPSLLNFKPIFKYSKSTADMIHSYDSDWGNDNLWFNEPYNYDAYYYGYYLAYDYFDQTNRHKNIQSNELILHSNKNLNLPLNSKIIIGFFNSKTNQNDIAKGWLFGGDATDLSSNFHIKNSAIFSNLNLNLTKSIELNINARYENHLSSYIAESNYYGVASQPIDTSKSDNFSGLNFTLKHIYNKTLLLYGSISKGYKAGGINQHPYLNNKSRFYNPEYNISFEFGGRKSFKNLKINFAFFTMQRENIQVQISSQQVENDPNSFTYYTSNSSSGHNNGFEFESSINILPSLNITSSFGYLDTYIEEFIFPVNQSIIDSSGARQQAMAPKYNGSLNIKYNHQTGLFFIGNITIKDEYYFSDSHNKKSEPYSLINCDFGYKKNNLILSIWGKNITDKRYAVRGFYFGLEPPNYNDKLYISYGNPKEIGIKLSYQF